MPPLVAKLCCTHLVHQESFCFSSFPCQKVLFFIFLMSFGYPFTSCQLSYFLSLIRFAVLTVRLDDHPYLIGSLLSKSLFRLPNILRLRPWRPHIHGLNSCDSLPVNNVYFTDWIKTNKSLKAIIDTNFSRKINSHFYQ